jgi:hypothetical protein
MTAAIKNESETKNSKKFLTSSSQI